MTKVTSFSCIFKMAARFPEEPATQQELMAIAREIPADKIDIVATQYLDIDDTRLTHIKDDAGYKSIQTNFKCLRHWCCNTLENHARRVLQLKLEKAAKEGLISEKGLHILGNPERGHVGGEGIYLILD